MVRISDAHLFIHVVGHPDHLYSCAIKAVGSVGTCALLALRSDRSDWPFGCYSVGTDAVAVSFFLALYFLTAKLVYLEQPFISGFIWMRIGAFFVAACLIFSKEVREDIRKPKLIQGKTWAIFFPNEIAGASAFVLQNWAIALAPLAFLGIINALEGIKFVFVLIFATILSVKFPCMGIKITT